MAKELFRPKYAPPGMTYRDAKAAGVLRESETWWLRLRHHGRTLRESTKATRHDEARRFLAARKAAISRGEPFVPKADHVTFAEMAERLKQDYELNGRDVATLNARLVRLLPFFGPRRMADLRPDDVETYKTQRHQAEAANGTINRELQILARAFVLGRKRGLLTATLDVRDHRLAEAAPRAGFFEQDQYEAVMRLLPDDLGCACTIAHVYGWRMQSEVLTLERRHVDLGAAEHGTLRLDPGQTKNDDARVVCLTPEVRALVEAQLSRVEAFQRRTGIITPYLFVHLTDEHRGQRIKDFKRAWQTACRKAGVPGRLRHDFRRTAVRNMVNAGVPERVAMQISGHRTRRVFDAYHIVSQADHVEAARRMAAAARAPRGQESGKVAALESRRG